MRHTLFISDLHLHASTPTITALFNDFLTKIAPCAESLYILGDLFAYWLGDDAVGEFEQSVAENIKNIVNQGVNVYFMPGNRDFLMGSQFCQKAGMIYLKDPTLIELYGQTILLKHGDDLCTLDVTHQRFRKWSQSRLIKSIFLFLPLFLRKKIVKKITQQSQNKTKSQRVMDVVQDKLVAELKPYDCKFIIHGHTHKPQLHRFLCYDNVMTQVVLSDWTDNINYLYFDYTNSIKLIV